MFIQTEPTPNPASMKFLLGRPVMTRGTADFPSLEMAHPSPLAQRLFEVDGVCGVFLGSNFVTVTKADNIDWFALKPAILATLAQHLASGEPVVQEQFSDGIVEAGPEGEIVRHICELLDTKVRPAVSRDGGDIIFRDFRDGVVYLRLQGSCAGCPSSTATLKNGVENLLRHYIPEVLAVRATD
ncbi:NifU-like domain protein [invertebrate metagenome]|uniref:NifU-like domain protein n=1 Tax=invertebrate metagenome TaxID=1711999 RepID=A0A484H4W9_9ZZZZ